MNKQTSDSKDKKKQLYTTINVNVHKIVWMNNREPPKTGPDCNFTS